VTGETSALMLYNSLRVKVAVAESVVSSPFPRAFATSIIVCR
jgi:hypothetical protein